MFVFDLPANVYSNEQADKLVSSMNADDDDDLTYVAKRDPMGKGGSIIEAYDEDGNFIGNF